MRQVLGVYGSPWPHRVGDGFPVRLLFSHAGHGEHVSPFPLLDHAGPAALVITHPIRQGELP